MSKKLFSCSRCDHVETSKDKIDTCPKCGSKMEELVGITMTDETPSEKIRYAHQI
jgi:Zn finger protein HypA/HybF involved in hydrogenase expression